MRMRAVGSVLQLDVFDLVYTRTWCFRCIVSPVRFSYIMEFSRASYCM